LDSSLGIGAAEQTDFGLPFVALQMPAVNQLARPKIARACGVDALLRVADICDHVRGADWVLLGVTCSTPTLSPGESVEALFARSIQGIPPVP
jgi:hypothetical protein